MSRGQLLEAARSLGIRTDVVARGKRGSKDNNWLRADILERCYGKNLGHIQAKTAAEIDKRVARAAQCATSRLGHLLCVAQGAIRDGRNALIEYSRLCSLQRRRPADEARQLSIAREALRRAQEAQDKWEAHVATVQR